MNGLREANAEPIAGYRLIEPIGSGGFGEVWKVEAPGGLHKAIKFVYGNLNSLDVDSVRAEQEKHAMKRMAEVRHPFICSLERIEEVDGELVIVMELADRSLHDLQEECKAAGLIGIPREDLLRYLRDAAEALDYMNEKYKLQHLDVKPRNLFLISDRVKVADFGLVKHLERQTASGLLGGVTPLYAPPETFNGKFSDRSDQYSLAIVYQELLTGQRPFIGKNVRQLAHAHLHEEPELRPLPEAERPIVARALAKDPCKRFPNCMAFIRALYGVRVTTKRDSGAPLAEPVLKKSGVRPKTLHETLEDIQLESPYDPSENVDLGAAPAPRNLILDDDDNEVEVSESELGRTVAQPSTGALRPTIIIGVGGFGRKAVLELRCRFVDRFSDLSKLPLLRFLCLDTDPEAVNMAVRGAPEVALTKSEIHALTLQQVGNYRKRMLDQLNEWLPREKLYAMPRSLQTQGSRALGRLAFVDHQQRLMARIRREIQEATNPDNIYQAVTQTGLALRDSTPRVYIIGSACGGSSGFLPDLGYAIRRLLQQMRQPEADTTLLMMCGAPNDPATPKHELANVYATVTEINHFSDPGVSFSAQYGVDGQRIIDQGTPYTASYLLPLANRSPDSLDGVVSHLGSYLFHELTTPLGLRLDQLRHHGNDGESRPIFGGVLTPFRSFGTYAVWFPRGLLLRLASRLACRRLIEGWQDPADIRMIPRVWDRVQTVVANLADDPGLLPDALARRIEEVCGGAPLSELGATPAEALTSLLATIEDQSLQNVAYDDPGNWARQAISRIRDWVGIGGDVAKDNHDWRKTKLNRALVTAAGKVADEWNQRLTPFLVELMELPGPRMEAAEQGLKELQQICNDAAKGQQEIYEQHCRRGADAWADLEDSLAECLQGAGGFRLFGGRSPRRLLSHFMTRLTRYAKQRLHEETLFAVRHFFIALNGRLGERLRDLGFCRQRLRHLHDELSSPFSGADQDMTSTKAGEMTISHSPLPSAESFWESIRQSQTARVVLPDGEVDLERAAVRFLQRLTPEQWTTLDKELNEHVLMPRGGLHGACIQGVDMTKTLAGPLMDEAVALLSLHLPLMDVAEILSGEFAKSEKGGPKGPQALVTQLQDYIDRAAPLLPRLSRDGDQRLLLLPASEAGKALGDLVQETKVNLKMVRVPGQSELMFCRENPWLTVQDLHKALASCRAAYDSLAASAPTSPHARFDIQEWLPLDP